MADDIQNVSITFNINIKKWRLDDQSIVENREWALEVYDRNLQEWVNVCHLNRPGESAIIESVVVK